MLGATVRQRLQEHYQRMSAEGKLLSHAQLDQFYATFRSRIGPDRLAGMDGESLLEGMHGKGTRTVSSTG